MRVTLEFESADEMKTAKLIEKKFSDIYPAFEVVVRKRDVEELV